MSRLPVRMSRVVEAAGLTASVSPRHPRRAFKRAYEPGGDVTRLSGTRRVRRLYGSSVAKEIVKGQTAAMFEGTAAQTVEACVFKRIARLL